MHPRNFHKYHAAIKSTTHSWIRYYFDHLCKNLTTETNMFLLTTYRSGSLLQLEINPNLSLAIYILLLSFVNTMRLHTLYEYIQRFDHNYHLSNQFLSHAILYMVPTSWYILQNYRNPSNSLTVFPYIPLAFYNTTIQQNFVIILSF